jgi:hypothetical protein
VVTISVSFPIKFFAGLIVKLCLPARSHPSLAALHLGSLAGEDEGEEEEKEEPVAVDTAGGGLSEINITLEKIPSCLVCARPPAMEANSDRYR